MLKSTISQPNHHSDTRPIGNDDDSQQRQQEAEQGQQQPTSTSAGDVLYNLGRFQTIRVLSNNSSSKTVSVLGHFTDLSVEERAIVLLEKTAFTESQVTTTTTDADGESENKPCADARPRKGEVTFFTESSRLTAEFVNDIYGNFLCDVDPSINRLKVTIIYPVTEKHIVKHSIQKRFLVVETPELYRTVTVPHLEEEQFTLQWLYNVLDHKKEKERIVYEDPCEENGFILLPDLKWDGKTVEQLYLLAVVRRRNIRSLRELTAEELPLLRNIKERGVAAIKDRYGIGESQLRIYVHYQPAFYHLHVHFNFLGYDPPGITCDRAHLLTTVINNIELVPDYYQRSHLEFYLKESDNLCKKFFKTIQRTAKGSEEPDAKRAKLDEPEED